MATVPVAASAPESEAPPRRRRRAFAKFARNRLALAGAAIVLIVIAVAALAPWLSPFDPIQADFLHVRSAPDGMHWFGTDELGRDIVSRMHLGRARIASGRRGLRGRGGCDRPAAWIVRGLFRRPHRCRVSRVADALLSIPFLILAIALAAFLGQSLTNAMIAIGISAMPRFVRLARGAGDRGEVRGVRRRRTRHRARRFAYRPALHFAERVAAHHRPGESRRSQRRSSRRRASHFSAWASCRPRRRGARCSTRRRTSPARRLGCRSFRVRPSS